jgi:hypothetical protein
MRAPESGLSSVSPALAMMLLPFPQTDIVPPKVVQCMLRNPYSSECVEGVFSEVHAGLSLVASCLLWKGMTCQISGWERRSLL